MPRLPLVRPRDEILQTIERIYRYRMTTTSGGNLSIRDELGDVWITPARVDKGSLRREDIVCVRADGRVEGRHPPSSEFPFHQAIYAARPDIRAVVHAHPVALVAFSICGRVPDVRLFHQARSICGIAGFAPYALPGSAMLGENIAAKFREGFDCVILENHGVVTGGADLPQAFARFETLEFTAKTIIKAGLLGEVRYLTEEKTQWPHQRLAPLPEFEPTRPTAVEQELRRELCEFIRRGYQQRLLISTQGSFSARLGDDSLIITPSRFDRRLIELADLVVVDGDRQERGKTASRAVRLHRAIYRRHPEVRAVVSAFPVNATAFGVTNTPLDSRTIPESYLLLKDVARIPYGPQFGDGREIAELVSPANPAAVLENDGVLICGTSVLDAFDRLEVLEATAEAIINSRPLGPVQSMPPAVIEELRRAFKM